MGIPEPAIKPPDRPPDHFQPPDQPPVRLADQPPDRLPNRLPDQLPFQSPGQLPDQLFLSRSQTKVLAFLCGLADRFTNRPAIQVATGLRYGTISDSIVTLKRKGFLSTKFSKRCEVSGFRFKLNSLLCEQFFSFGQPPDRPPIQPPGRLPGEPPEHSSSSFSSFVKPTTTNRPPEQPPVRPPETSIEAIQAILDSDPEFGYWLSKGITPYQIRSWLIETSTELEILVKSLHHAAFQLNSLEEEKSRNIKKVLDYFYSIYKKNRFWPKPPGYKSHLQKEIEFRENVIRERAQEETRLAEIEIEETFEEIMADQNSELYKRLEAHLNPFSRAKSPDSPARRAAMRDLFNRLVVRGENV
jgi:hypothetical protein